MKKSLKILGILVGCLVLLAAVGVGVVFLYIDSIAKNGIERGATYALGVKTSVDSVSVHVLAGDVSIGGLDVANPEGYAGKHFLAMSKGDVVVTLSSLREDTVLVPRIALTGIDVSLEKTDKGSNYQKIIDNLAKLKGTGGTRPTVTGKEKRYVIHELTIDKVNIHADMLGAPGDIGKVVNSMTKVDVPIEQIHLYDVGKTGSGVNGTGVTLEELSSIIVQAVLAAASEKGGLPAAIAGDLKKGVDSLGDLANIPVGVVGKAGETVQQIGGKAAEEVKKDLGNAVDKIGKGIGDLLGGNKDKKEPPKKP